MNLNPRQVYKATFARWVASVLGAILISSGLQAESYPELPVERFAALECQNSDAVVIVNFYPGHRFKLSWGYDLNLEVEDLSVSQSFEDGLEIYRGGGLLLRLPSRPGSASNEIRSGSLYATNPVRLILGSLRCLLHGAD